MIKWTNEKRKLSDLVPWKKNPRQLTEKQAKQLKKSLAKFGQAYPLLISPNNEIYDGHQREGLMKLMKEYGEDAVIDVRVSSRKLTLKERKELVVRLHENVGEWDLDGIANLYDRDELEEWGFSADILNKLDFTGDELVEDPGAQIDKAEELREKWGVESGQLWQLGEHRVICGDCTKKEVVNKILIGNKKKITITDPPYNVGIDFGEKTDDNRSFEDYVNWSKKWLKLSPDRKIFTIGVSRLFWWKEIAGIPLWVIAWIKKNGQGNTKLRGTGKWDAILLYNIEPDYDIDIVEINNEYGEGIKSKGLHPTAKPIALYEYLINRFSKSDWLIYEPFLGSGTTLIACERLSRKCYGVEIEPKYVAVTLERWHQMTGKTPVLVDGQKNST